MQTIDLHVHSTRSDGTFTPAELVDYAMEKGLAAFALTDHDTIEGLDETIKYADGLRASLSSPEKVPEVIPGIEFSTEYEGKDIHILGLYIDYQKEAFHRHLRAFVDSRTARNRKMCDLLQKAGISITYEALLAEFPDAVVTRAHYARYMLNHGYISSMTEAFERYIGDCCPCYVPREKITPVQAVKLVLESGGVPILAHPVLYHMSTGQLEILIQKLQESGLAGLEAIYSTYNDAEERRMRALASRYGLLISGGSDFHGSNKPGLDLASGYGKLFVPYSVLDAINNFISRRNL
nr:PHP domain-containing protein [uncultured Acetatifactor sp.]